ncbi:MAG TPA: CPBP family intramembrane metalloprotease [archaeon]|nr:CPBP family intramembrane metalloprotease [archaeon]
MAIQLGENPWILILLMFLELFLIIVPGFISSRIEKKPISEVILDMGFQKNENFIIKIIAGISFGILFFFIGNYIIIFFRDFIVKNLFGVQFIQQGQSGAIIVTPIQPNLVQIIILIILQIIIIGPSEEAFFRGFIIKKLNEKLKLQYSIIISAICFTLYHVPPFLVPLTTIITFFGYYFTFGLILSLIFINFENSIIPNSVAHSCFNILILLL